MEDAMMIIDLVASLVVKKLVEAETEEESGEGIPLPFQCARHGYNLMGESPECGLIAPST